MVNVSVYTVVWFRDIHAVTVFVHQTLDLLCAQMDAAFDRKYLPAVSPFLQCVS